MLVSSEEGLGGISESACRGRHTYFKHNMSGGFCTNWEKQPEILRDVTSVKPVHGRYGYTLGDRVTSVLHAIMGVVCQRINSRVIDLPFLSSMLH